MVGAALCLGLICGCPCRAKPERLRLHPFANPQTVDGAARFAPPTGTLYDVGQFDFTARSDRSSIMSRCQVGRPAPDFALDCVSSGSAPHRVALGDYTGRWLVLIFYPRDFSFICPTELTSFSAQVEDFKTRDCELLGVSVDSLQTHQQWLSTPPSQGGLGPLRFPLAADPDGAAARAYDVWSEEKGVSTRGLFVVDPAGVLQYIVVHNLRVGAGRTLSCGFSTLCGPVDLPGRLDIGGRHPRSRKSPSAGPRARPLPDPRAASAPERLAACSPPGTCGCRGWSP